MNIFKKAYDLIPAPVRKLRHDVLGIIQESIHLLLDGFYDISRFASHSSALRITGTRHNREAKLTFLYHKIEKALALPNTRPGFGKSWILNDFMPLIRSFVHEYGSNTVTDACLQNLKVYRDFNSEKKYYDEELFSSVDEILKDVQMSQDTAYGGIQTIVKSPSPPSYESFSEFMMSRHSVRDFSQEPVDKGLVEKAVQMAQRTPSVCNRQPWHVYAYDKKSEIDSALKLQNGNAGFGDRIHMLIITAGNTSAMLNSTERNQFRIDGGMFSMSLVLALHSLGLGTCCLNLCHRAKGEKRLRKFIGMDAHHSPLMMIAVGHTPEIFSVAVSPRKSVSEVVTWK